MVVASTSDPEVALPPHDATVVRLIGDDDDDDLPETGGSDVTVAGPLGAQLLLWEAATAVAGRLLGINPFDQPDVESAKTAARSMLEGTPDAAPPDAVDGPVEIRALGGDWLGDASTVERRGRRAARRARRRGRLRRGDGLPRPAPPRRPARTYAAPSRSAPGGR